MGRTSLQKPTAAGVVQDDYRIVSTSFAVRSVHEGIADALRWHLEPFRSSPVPEAARVDIRITKEDAAQEPSHLSLFREERLRYRSRSAPSVLINALWGIYSDFPILTQDFVLLHAGVVARGGRGALLPAQMNSGKSSLTLALLMAGWSYLSDEFGCLDPDSGLLVPVEKPIKLDPAGVGLFPGLEQRLRDRTVITVEHIERFVRPRDVGAAVSDRARVELVVFPQPEFGGAPKMRPLSRAEGVRRMSAAGFNLYRFGPEGVLLLTRIMEHARAYELTGGTPSERASLISDHLDE